MDMNCVSKVSEEILDVLVENKVPIGQLENIFKEVKNMVNRNTCIQKLEANKKRA